MNSNIWKVISLVLEKHEDEMAVLANIASGMDWLKQRMADMQSLQRVFHNLFSNVLLWLKVAMWIIVITVVTSLPEVNCRCIDSLPVEASPPPSLFRYPFIAVYACDDGVALLRRFVRERSAGSGVLSDYRVRRRLRSPLDSESAVTDACGRGSLKPQLQEMGAR